MRRLFFIAAFCITTLLINGQPRSLNLNDVIATSLQNNYDIQLVRNDAAFAALDYAYANYSLLPRLNATAGLLNNNNNQQQVLADGTKRESKGIRSNNISTSLNLNWTLFDGFRMFIARDRLNRLVELSELQIKGQVITTVAQVMQLYYDIIRQQQQLQALSEQIGLSEERFKIAQYKFDIGTGAKPDLLQAQIDLNAQRAASLTQQTTINKIKEQLNQLLVLPVNTDFSVADTTITFNPDLTLDSITTAVITTNPDLLLAQRNLTLSELDLRLRRAERYPIVEFNSAYNFSRTDNKSVINPFQPLFNQNKGLNYGFSAIIPIFNGFENRRLQKAARLNIQSQQLLYDRTAALVNTSISNAFKDYELFKQALVLEEENLLLVRENIFIARERYRLGISTFLELREAQQSLADATNRLINARYNAKIAEIELLRLRGDLVK